MQLFIFLFKIWIYVRTNFKNCIVIHPVYPVYVCAIRVPLVYRKEMCRGDKSISLPFVDNRYRNTYLRVHRLLFIKRRLRIHSRLAPRGRGNFRISHP